MSTPAAVVRWDRDARGPHGLEQLTRIDPSDHEIFLDLSAVDLVDAWTATALRALVELWSVDSREISLVAPRKPAARSMLAAMTGPLQSKVVPPLSWRAEADDVRRVLLAAQRLSDLDACATASAEISRSARTFDRTSVLVARAALAVFVENGLTYGHDSPIDIVASIAQNPTGDEIHVVVTDLADHHLARQEVEDAYQRSVSDLGGLSFVGALAVQQGMNLQLRLASGTARLAALGDEWVASEGRHVPGFTAAAVIRRA